MLLKSSPLTGRELGGGGGGEEGGKSWGLQGAKVSVWIMVIDGGIYGEGCARK